MFHRTIVDIFRISTAAIPSITDVFEYIGAFLGASSLQPQLGLQHLRERAEKALFGAASGSKAALWIDAFTMKGISIKARFGWIEALSNAAICFAARWTTLLGFSKLSCSSAREL